MADPLNEGRLLWEQLFSEALGKGVWGIHIFPPAEQTKILFNLDLYEEVDAPTARAISEYIRAAAGIGDHPYEQQRVMSLRFVERNFNFRVNTFRTFNDDKQYIGDRLSIHVQHGVAGRRISG